MTKENNVIVSIVGGNHRGDREAEDFYPSPAEITYALVHYELPYFEKYKVLEPCCGDGAISVILEDFGVRVRSQDLIDRGFGETGIDFLQTKKSDCQAIITNPPFNLSEAFIRHGFDTHGVKYMAMFLKASYWHAASRKKLFLEHQPSRVYALQWRPDFKGQGGPTMDFIWVVWDDNAPKNETRYLLMDKIVGLRSKPAKKRTKKKAEPVNQEPVAIS